MEPAETLEGGKQTGQNKDVMECVNISLFHFLKYSITNNSVNKVQNFFFFKEVKIHMSIGQDALDENSL